MTEEEMLDVLGAMRAEVNEVEELTDLNRRRLRDVRGRLDDLERRVRAAIATRQQ